MSFFSKPTGRRVFLAALLVGLKSTASYVEDTSDRTTRAKALARMLRGEPGSYKKLLAFGELFGYRQLVELLVAVCGVSEAESKQLLRAVAAIIMTEDSNGTHFDVWDVPERFTLWCGRTFGTDVRLSESFGWGQVQAPTALRVLRKHRDRLTLVLPQLAAAVRALPVRPTKADVVSAADLLGDGNIIITALIVHEGFAAYQLATGPVVSTDPHHFELAAAGYFCGVTAPGVARLQAMHNTLCLGRGGAGCVAVDGSFGNQSAVALSSLATRTQLHPDLLAELFGEPSLRGPALTALQQAILPEWEAMLATLCARPKPANLAALCGYHQEGAELVYTWALSSCEPNQELLVRRLYRDYLDRRSFVGNIVVDQSAYEALCPRSSYAEFLEWLSIELPTALLESGRWSGQVPTALGSWLRLGDRVNPLGRVSTARRFLDS